MGLAKQIAAFACSAGHTSANAPQEPQSFPGCCAAPSARLRASSTRYALRRGALLIRGPSRRWLCCMGPGSAEQRDRTMLRIAGSTLHRVRDTRGNCASRPCGDLPVGRFVDRGVESHLQKYFCFHIPQITSRTFRIPPQKRGVS